MFRTVITTLCIGDVYRRGWDRHCRKNWEAYAQRHGFDLVILDAALDASERAAGRSAAWQKCLVLDRFRQYDRVVWLDADIVINGRAPSIVEGIAPGSIGAVISGSYIHPDLRPLFLTRSRGYSLEAATQPQAWERDQMAFYQRLGLTCESSEIVQTGVLVIDQTHRELMKAVYDFNYPSDLPCNEQFPLSASIVNSHLLHRLNSRFNVVFAEQAWVHYPYLFQGSSANNPELWRHALQTELDNSFFLHLAMWEFKGRGANPGELGAVDRH